MFKVTKSLKIIRSGFGSLIVQKNCSSVSLLTCKGVEIDHEGTGQQKSTASLGEGRELTKLCSELLKHLEVTLADRWPRSSEHLLKVPHRNARGENLVRQVVVGKVLQSHLLSTWLCWRAGLVDHTWLHGRGVSNSEIKIQDKRDRN